MTKEMLVYSETLSDAKQWIADTADTFQMMTAPGNPAWPEMLPLTTITKKPLMGLLIMGSTPPTFPYSFGERGFPQNASREVTEVYLEYTEARYASALTRDDLEAKVGELMILPDQQALSVRPLLVDLVRMLPDFHGDPKHQRIVFWQSV